jgi:signal transduction histidine kinase/CheY-like chemotaxis protein
MSYENGICLVGVKMNQRNVISANDWTKNWNGGVGTKITAILVWTMIVTSLSAMTFYFADYDQKLQRRFHQEAVELIHNAETKKINPSQADLTKYFADQIPRLSMIQAGTVTVGQQDAAWGKVPKYSYKKKYLHPMDKDRKEVDVQFTFIGKDLVEVRELAKKQMMAAFMVFLVFASMIIKFVVKMILSTPQKKLLEVMERIQNGGMNTRIDENRNDEFGVFSKVFNRAMDAIEENQIAMQESEAKAKAANDAKTVFLANMSHEIRTPLTSIMGFAEGIKRKGHINPSDNKALQVLGRNSEHLMKIINEILDMSKIEQGKMEIESIEVRLNHLLYDVESILTINAENKNLQFKVDKVFPLPSRIYTDPTRLKQVLLNICGNAIKFTEKGEVCLKVAWDDQNDKLTFSIQDTGIGMTEAQVVSIFKPFHQADVSTTRKFGGTGLGLHISQQIVKKFKGEIQVTSEEGKGSRFEFGIYVGEPAYLDFADKWESKEKTQDKVYSSKGMHGTLLVVEDTEDIRILISSMLDESDVEVEFAINGKEAISKTSDKQYDLVLMDAQMPVMGGVEATKNIRSNGYEGPIVFLTANAMKEDFKTYEDAGSNGQLSKPIIAQEFYSKIGIFLGAPMVVEMTQASERKKGDRYKKALDNYMSKLPEKLQQLREAMEACDYVAMKQIIHSLQGSCGSFGLKTTYQTCLEFDKYLKGLKPSVNEFLEHLEKSIAEDNEEVIDLKQAS